MRQRLLATEAERAKDERRLQPYKASELILQVVGFGTNSPSLCTFGVGSSYSPDIYYYIWVDAFNKEAAGQHCLTSRLRLDDDGQRSHGRAAFE